MEKVLKNIKIITKPGRCHEYLKQKCEDVTLIDDYNDVVFVGLADGQSKKIYCKEGGMQVLDSVKEYFLHECKYDLFDIKNHPMLIRETSKTIQGVISNMSNTYGTDPKEFSSTMVVMVYSRVNENAVLVHIGDGSVIAVDRERKISCLSPPENGVTSRYTFFTTSERLEKHIRVQYWKLSGYTKALLMSDGAEFLIKGKRVIEEASNHMKEGDDSICKYIRSQRTEDDFSVIIVEFREE